MGAVCGEVGGGRGDANECKTRGCKDNNNCEAEGKEAWVYVRFGGGRGEGGAKAGRKRDGVMTARREAGALKLSTW